MQPFKEAAFFDLLQETAIDIVFRLGEFCLGRADGIERRLHRLFIGHRKIDQHFGDFLLAALGILDAFPLSTAMGSSGRVLKI